MSYRAGYCGLIGMPNSGKSSLMNWLVQDKVSIVTNKPQTTRRRILGLKSSAKGQAVLVDAPGIIKAEKGLNQYLENEISQIIDESDALLAVLSLDEAKKDNLDQVIDMVQKSKKPFIVVLNKVDLGKFENRKMVLERELREKVPDAKIFSISNKKSEGRDDLAAAILEMLPVSKAPLFDPELLSPMPTRDLVAEFVREQCFIHLHQEIPFGTAVKVARFEEKGHVTKIMADIIVAKESFKPIVIGQGGLMIKQIGTAAREQIEKFLGVSVYLDLNVIIKESWTDNKRWMKELGYFHEKHN